MRCGLLPIRDYDPILVPLKGTDGADQSAVHLLYQEIAQTCLSLAVVGALERVRHVTFGSVK